MFGWEYIFLILGLCGLFAAVFDLEWYYSNLGTPSLARIVGRKGVRILYALIGLLCVVLGLAGFAGLIE